MRRRLDAIDVAWLLLLIGAILLSLVMAVRNVRESDWLWAVVFTLIIPALNLWAMHRLWHGASDSTFHQPVLVITVQMGPMPDPRLGPVIDAASAEVRRGRPLGLPPNKEGT